MSLLLPPGITHLGDCPYTLHAAICHALRFLHWQEHLEAGEVPPRRIWLDPERLSEHFKGVERKRKKKYGIKGDDDGGDPDGGTDDNAVELISRGR